MFEPNADNPQYPVFRKIDGRIIPGLTKGSTVLVAIVLAVGLLLFFLLGNVKHNVETALNQTEWATLANEYKNELTVLQYQELEKKADRLEEKENLTLEQSTELSDLQTRMSVLMSTMTMVASSEQDEFANRAREHGLTADMTSADVEEIVPWTTIKELPVIPDGDRFSWFVLFPVALITVLSWEIGGISMMRNIRVNVRHMRSPKFYYLQKGSLDE